MANAWPELLVLRLGASDEVIIVPLMIVIVVADNGDLSLFLPVKSKSDGSLLMRMTTLTVGATGRPLHDLLSICRRQRLTAWCTITFETSDF